MLGHDGKYYAYASTDLNGHEVQVATSDEGFFWTFQEGVTALAYNANWTKPDSPLTWAPDVWPAEGGRYWMYYSAQMNDDTGRHCIGFAVGSDPMDMAPLSDDLYTEPWACHEQGLIDPAMFQDVNGNRYVLYKVDGNSVDPGTTPTPIMLQRVAGDGRTKIGDPIELIDRDDNDGPLIENPNLVHENGIYYLTFSSNWYNSKYYDVSFATATNVEGPYTKVLDPDAPIIVTDDSKGLWGPGGADMVKTKMGTAGSWRITIGITLIARMIRRRTGGA